MNCIRPWLWIGDYHDSSNRAALAAHGIGTLLHLVANVRHPAVVTVYLPVKDAALLAADRLEAGIAAVHEAHERGEKLLIACGAGISRSATFATAALWAIEGLPLRDAFAAVKAAHPQALPHPALWESLCRYTGEDVTLEFL